MPRRTPIPAPLPPEDLPELINKLVQVQEAMDYTNAQFAAFLGVPFEVWARVKGGEIDMNILPGVSQVWPQWSWMVQRFLQGLDGRLPAVDARERARQAREAWEKEQSEAESSP